MTLRPDLECFTLPCICVMLGKIFPPVHKIFQHKKADECSDNDLRFCPTRWLRMHITKDVNQKEPFYHDRLDHILCIFSLTVIVVLCIDWTGLEIFA